MYIMGNKILVIANSKKKKKTQYEQTSTSGSYLDSDSNKPTKKKSWTTRIFEH